jgi:hypothetical protein
MRSDALWYSDHSSGLNINNIDFIMNNISLSKQREVLQSKNDLLAKQKEHISMLKTKTVTLPKALPLVRFCHAEVGVQKETAVTSNIPNQFTMISIVYLVLFCNGKVTVLRGMDMISLMIPLPMICLHLCPRSLPPIAGHQLLL